MMETLNKTGTAGVQFDQSIWSGVYIVIESGVTLTYMRVTDRARLITKSMLNVLCY